MTGTADQQISDASTGNTKPVRRLKLADCINNPSFNRAKAPKHIPNSSDSEHNTSDSTSASSPTTPPSPASASSDLIALRIPRKNSPGASESSPVASPQKLVFPTGPARAAIRELKELQEQAERDEAKFTAWQREQISVQITCWEQLMMLSNEKAPKDLRELAERVLIKHKTEIESVGDISYQVVRAVLKTIDSAPQLKIIEKNSPHICAEDQELWRKLITKDFGIGAMSKYEIEDNNRWSALYDKHREEQSREHDRVADTMKKVMEATEAQKKTMTTKLDKTLVMPVKRTRGTNEGWGAGNNWDAKVGMKTKDIVKKSKIEADQVALRNKSANKKPIARTQINSSMAEALRMRHQNRVELTTNTSKKRTRTEDAPAPTPAKRTRTTELDSRNQPKTANKEDHRQDNRRETRRRDNRPQQDRPQQDRPQQDRPQQDRPQYGRQRNPKTNARVEARRQRMHSEERDERDERRHERSRSGSWEDQIWAERREPPRHEQPTGSGSMARFLTPPERNGRNDRSNERNERSNERRQDDRRQPSERNGRNDNRNERRQDDRRQDSRRNDNERRQDQHRRNDNRQHPYRRN